MMKPTLSRLSSADSTDSAAASESVTSASPTRKSSNGARSEASPASTNDSTAPALAIGPRPSNPPAVLTPKKRTRPARETNYPNQSPSEDLHPKRISSLMRQEQVPTHAYLRDH